MFGSRETIERNELEVVNRRLRDKNNTALRSDFDVVIQTISFMLQEAESFTIRQEIINIRDHLDRLERLFDEA